MLIKPFVASVMILTSTLAMAHGRYILPSHTSLSGEESGKETVTLLASITNDIYHADRAFGDNGTGARNGVVAPGMQPFFATLDYQLITPSGEVKPFNEWQAFKRLSVADLTLIESGTYRISTVQSATPMTTFRTSDGKPGRVFGKTPVPEGAKDIHRLLTQSRVETFVSFNDMNDAALNLTGKGLEIMGHHPNDLFSGEEITFQLFLDGKPLKETADIKFTLEGTRHRRKRNEITTQNNEKGEFSLRFPQSGFYLMEASVGLPHKNKDVDTSYYGLYVTFEVFPQ